MYTSRLECTSWLEYMQVLSLIAIYFFCRYGLLKTAPFKVTSRETWWRHCDATFNCRCNTYWLEMNTCKVCLNMINIWSWSNAKKFGFWPGKRSLKKKNKGKIWPSSTTGSKGQTILTLTLQMLPKSWSIRCPIMNIIALVFHEIQ